MAGSAPLTVAIVAPDILTRALYVRVLRAAGYVPLVLGSYDALLGLASPSACVAILDAPVDPILLESVPSPVPIVLVTNSHVGTTGDRRSTVARPFTPRDLLGAIDALIPRERPHSRPPGTQGDAARCR